MAKINQVKISSTTYDLDNRYVELSATSGTLTTDQLALLQASNQNYIVYVTGGNSLTLRLMTVTSTALTYGRISPTTSGSPTVYSCIVTISSRAYSITNNTVPNTLNTAGSNDTSSKIFLVGTTSQTTGSNGLQSYSDNQVYATNGQLDANKVRIAEAVTMVYDSTNKCINFNFA